MGLTSNSTGWNGITNLYTHSSAPFFQIQM